MAAETTKENVQELNLVGDFTAVVRLGGITIEIKPDGSVSRNGVALAPLPADGAANDAKPVGDARIVGKPAPQGDADHAGFYYAGRDKEGDLWVKPAPKMMNHFEAAAWAKEQGGALPTRAQGKHLDTVKNEGDFTTLFNKSGSFPAGFVWLAEPHAYLTSNAWCQRLSVGYQNYGLRVNDLPVLCVRR